MKVNIMKRIEQMLVCFRSIVLQKDLLQACFSTVMEPQVPRDFVLATGGDGFAYIYLILEVSKFSAASETESLMLIMEEVAGE